MATRHEVLCINKVNRTSPFERIAHIGGMNSNGSRWKITVDEAIEGIETGKWQFYVRKHGHIVEVVIIERLGRKYLKTENDGDSPDNLLSLPECP